MVGENTKKLSSDEVELYDRQIRLWGFQSQKRLQAARILLIGLNGMGAEVAKNIALTGVKSLTLLDSIVASQEDRSSQFLIPGDKLGTNRAEASLAAVQQLNPMVQMEAMNTKLEDVPDSFFANFDVVCMTVGNREQLVRVNHICRDVGIKFLAGAVFGFFGFTFSDLQEHHYTDEIPDLKRPAGGSKKSEEKRMKIVKGRAAFVPLQDALDIDWTSDDYSKRLKRMDSGFFILKVLLKFVGTHGRNPSPRNRTDDLSELRRMRDEVLESLCIPLEKVDDQTLELTLGSVSPACAVAGGVMAQEVIKAVSLKDAPYNNFFFLNPITFCGTVQLLGN